MTDEPPAAGQAPRPIIQGRNLGEPIELRDVQLGGFAAEAARPPNPVKIWTRLALSSDEPLFHKLVENLVGALAHLTQQAGSHLNLNAANDMLLIIRADKTAQLWVNAVAVSINVRAKRAVAAGEPLFDSDIADITELRFPFVNIGSTDKIVYLFRQDWRFGLFFDFNPAKDLSISEMEKAIGTLYRRLRYKHLYDILADRNIFGRLIDAGWFPFVEIVGREFKELALACEAGFPLEEAEENLVKNFDAARLDRVFERWMSRPHFKRRERLLASAINAYKAQEPVAVIKIVLTEMEGILLDAHKATRGGGAKLKQLLEFARTTAEEKAGAPDTLFFPAAFAEYLEKYTYANFDPRTQEGDAGSRHAVGHGAALADTYTQSRALRAILTLDQFAFYT